MASSHRHSLSDSSHDPACSTLCGALEQNDVDKTTGLLQVHDWSELQTVDKRRPLNIAVGQSNAVTVRLLLEHGCSVNIPDGRGKYPLHEAALTDKPDTLLIVQMLLDSGANPNAKDTYQETPLMTACYWSNSEVVELFALRSSDLNYKPHRAAIHYAAMRNNKEVICHLLNHGASANLMDDDFETPLIIATRSKSMCAVKALLRHDCDLDSKGFMDYTALHWAVYANHSDIVKELLEYNAAIDKPNSLDRLPIHIAASCNAVKSIQFLLEAGANTDVLDSNGLTPLMTAVQVGFQDIVKLLLYGNADPDQCPYPRNHGKRKPPLIVALENTFLSIAKDLIVAGCDLHAYWLHHGNLSNTKAPSEFFRNMAKSQSKMADLVQNYICRPTDLQHLCRLSIRRQLSRSYKVIQDINKLQLPRALKDYVSMKDML